MSWMLREPESGIWAPNQLPGQLQNQQLEAWNRRVRAYALEQNRRFPEPLDEREVVHTAYSISTWCWSGGGAKSHYPRYFRHDSRNQSKRGIKSGKVRRARNAERDSAIVVAVESGQSMRAVAREWGINEKMVRHVMARVRNEP